MAAVILLLVPFIASLLLLLVKGGRTKSIALAFSIIELAATVYCYRLFTNDPSAAFLKFDQPWISQLGIHFNIAIDGITLVLLLLTNILMPLIILSTAGKDYKSAFYSLMMFMQMALVGVFMAMDGFLFYIFWELALIPIYFICLLWGGENRIKVTFKFFLYTLVGSLFMLVALIYLYQHSGSHSFNIQSLYQSGKGLTLNEQSFVFWCMFLAFAIKMPIFPFHTWQPDTYTTAPTPGTMLLSGIMLKMGIYGLIRWLIPVVPMGIAEWGHTAMVLCVIGIIYASCIAIVQKDFKRLIAYSSIAHVGLIGAGVFSLTVQGMQGAMIQMFSHGVNVVGLFFIVDMISSRTGTHKISELGGIRNVAPHFATAFLIVLLGSVALPLTNGFVGEFLLINGIYQYSFWFSVFAGLTVILGAVYMLRSYQNIMLGETNTVTETFSEVTFNDKIVLIPIIVLIIGLGVYPKVLLDISEPAVNELVNGLKLTMGK